MNQHEWQIFDIINIVLNPFVQATNLISGSQYPTIGITYFSIAQIPEFLEDSTNIDLDINYDDMNLLIYLKQLLLDQIEKYFIQNDEE